MLHLKRKIGDAIMINGGIEIKVMGFQGAYVQLGLSFPEGTQVLRKEVYDAICQENLQALGSGFPCST